MHCQVWWGCSKHGRCNILKVCMPWGWQHVLSDYDKHVVRPRYCSLGETNICSQKGAHKGAYQNQVHCRNTLVVKSAFRSNSVMVKQLNWEWGLALSLRELGFIPPCCATLCFASLLVLLPPGSSLNAIDLLSFCATAFFWTLSYIFVVSVKKNL